MRALPLVLLAFALLAASALGAGESPDFSLVVGSPSASAPAGGSTSVVVTVEGQHSYDGPSVDVSLESAEPGITGICSPSPVAPTGSCTMTVSVAAGVARGQYALTIVGSNGTATRTASATLEVTPAAPPTIDVALGAGAASLVQGGAASVSVSVVVSGSFAGPVALSASDVPPGVAATFLPSILPGSGTSELRLTANAGAVPGTYTIRVFAGKGSVRDTADLTLVVTPPSSAGQDQPTLAGLPWWLVLFLAGGAAVLGAAVWRTRSGRWPLLPSPAAAVGAAGRSARSAFVVENVFLLYRDGRVIFSRAAPGPDSVDDPEIIGAMLVAIQDFIKESFKRGAAIDRMSHGDDSILIARGDHAILAATVFGEPGAEFREVMSEAVRKLEASYAGMIEAWDGDRAAFPGLEALLAPVWVASTHTSREDVVLATTAREVQMLSGVEFFQGFVRLKVSAVNNTPTLIAGVTADVDYNADVLRLHKIEPATYKTSGSKVFLGVLQPGEKAGLAYYFDPQICTSSVIDGSCRYKDAAGAPHVVTMKSRKAEVVCPLFFTKEQANTAVLRRLVESELRQYDVRAYRFKADPSDKELESLFGELKSAVLAHDVQLVRSYERHRPAFAEAWFYGRTQVKGYSVVIRAAADASRRQAEFFVASNAIRSVTGLLAELHHTFSLGARDRLGTLEIAPLFDEQVRRTYASPVIVSKLVEGEAQAGETER